MILGIDEVGRGPWAGPLVVGAVVLGGELIEGLTDSKKLTKKRREELDPEIRTKASGYGLGWVSAMEIDQIGLSEALRLATIRAVKQVKTPYHEIIIDGTVNFLAGTSREKFVSTLKKGDLLVPSISAASIIAKVARDNYMEQQDSLYPGYSFASHAGYGTAKHRAAIDLLGVTPLHRLSFAPLQKYAKPTESAAVSLETPVTTKQIGDHAERLVADHLTSLGHQVVARNWRTRFCEIDIVSVCQRQLYFTEVKYRKNNDYGDGLAAVTKTKSRQMRFAAELFIVKHSQYDSQPALLQVASVVGQPARIVELIELD